MLVHFLSTGIGGLAGASRAIAPNGSVSRIHEVLKLCFWAEAGGLGAIYLHTVNQSRILDMVEGLLGKSE